MEDALKEADTGGFKPYLLGVRLKGHFPTRVEKMVSNNVVGMAEGSDPVLKSEAVVFTAHRDHLGVGRAVLGDAIYNRAADNATGCALLIELARAWSAQNRLEIETDERAHLGIFYRSDHFSMAQAGIPAFSVSPGMKVKGKPKDFARGALKEFNDKAYHSPQDELKPEWDFSGFPVLARFSLDVARAVANADPLPTWNRGDEFRPAREKSGVK